MSERPSVLAGRPRGEHGGGVPRLAGLVGLVTGGSRGIGLAVARQLAAEGARVVITGRDQRSLDDACALLPAERVVAVRGAAADPAHRGRALSTAVEAFGGIDLLVNNVATTAPRSELTSVGHDDFLAAVETNCLTPLAWVREACEQGLATGGGSVVNLSSALARATSRTGLGVYVATKAMLESLTAQLALELAPAIRVNAVAPGLVRTDLAAARLADDERAIAATYPLARVGEPDDVAATVCHLLSRDARWITGQSILVDGGISVRSAL
ncbi:SDR family oxidoreductase [Nocardioides sp. QY071]|uniref:SDR family oxidoreductase n=1 Tax=Nocardioides sp. QY071 TaxID=3044187 RepID=UPI00249ABB27|nr:SDR family oxidoreductase [Nocardioides sp. QY071]WGY02892.1 SDR family oxidoreductase [Nocardioides sp. QY071]